MTPLAAHADWSVSPKKRWMSVAAPARCGWQVSLEPVGQLECLLSRLRSRAGRAPVALGIDAPIGLPSAFRQGSDFPSFLKALAPDDRFFDVCAVATEIGRARPFFPLRAQRGMRRRELLDRLGLESGEQMLRLCERRLGTQPEAAPMFWTLGANQVGKGALRLWQDLLLPALQDDDPPSLWPFNGDLAALLQAGRTVLAECYPANAMRQMRLGMTGSKRRQSDRAAIGGALWAKLDELEAVPEPDLAAQINEGFGSRSDGEDRFDSLIGLLRMLEVIRDPSLDQLPAPEIRRWEGWILGRPLSMS